MKAIHTLMFICLYTLSYGQKNNESDTGKKKLYRHTLAFGLGNHRVFNVPRQGSIPFYDVHFNYMFNFSNRFSVQVGHAFWRDPEGVSISYVLPAYFERLHDPYDTLNIGKRVRTTLFHYFDLSAVYTFKLPKQHRIRLIAGPSVAIAMNAYIKSMSMIYYNEPWGVVPHLVSYSEDGRYETTFGGQFGIGYNYLLFKEHLSIGAELRGRVYNTHPFHINYLLNVGYNFNLKASPH